VIKAIDDFLIDRVFQRISDMLIHRQAEPPPKLDQLEQEVMAANVPPDVLIRRDTLRDLLRYVRRLERDVAEMGSFW
jgi:hypothetical protein